MTTTFDIENILWKKLDSSSLKTAITGKIRKLERPANSDKEDIVVNSLPAPNTKLQIAVANINIFVPDITKSENGVQEKLPDHKRMKTLTDAVIGVVNEVFDGTYYYEVQQQQMIEDKESNSHFINIRMNFISENF